MFNTLHREYTIKPMIFFEGRVFNLLFPPLQYIPIDPSSSISATHLHTCNPLHRPFGVENRAAKSDVESLRIPF